MAVAGSAPAPAPVAPSDGGSAGVWDWSGSPDDEGGGVEGLCFRDFEEGCDDDEDDEGVSTQHCIDFDPLQNP